MKNKYPCANTQCRHSNTVARPGEYCRECEKEMERVDRRYEELTRKSDGSKWDREKAAR